MKPKVLWDDVPAEVKATLAERNKEEGTSRIVDTSTGERWFFVKTPYGWNYTGHRSTVDDEQQEQRDAAPDSFAEALAEKAAEAIDGWHACDEPGCKTCGGPVEDDPGPRCRIDDPCEECKDLGQVPHTLGDCGGHGGFRNMQNHGGFARGGLVKGGLGIIGSGGRESFVPLPSKTLDRFNLHEINHSQETETLRHLDGRSERVRVGPMETKVTIEADSQALADAGIDEQYMMGGGLVEVTHDHGVGLPKERVKFQVSEIVRDTWGTVRLSGRAVEHEVIE